MKYSITFKDLPFMPEDRQVIYVENQYDERINAIIKEKYNLLKYQFKRANLDFVYLPMFFDDEEIKEKVLYYAPYLTSEIMEKVELRSSYLLGYMSHLENKVKIMPSFLYAPQKEGDEWVFQGLTIDISEKENFSINNWFEDTIYDIEEELTPITHSRYQIEDKDESLLVTGESIHESQAEYSSTPNFWEKAERGLKKFAKKCVEEEGDYSGTNHEPAPSSLDEINEKDVRDTIEELERNIERLRLLGIPLAAIAEFVAKYETVSRIKFTDDLKIFLPDYNNLEVKMGALYKAVYFLFINHPEGIILKRLEEYHHELTNYYLQASGRDSLTQKMYESINTLEYPGNNYINTILSKIKMCFKATIDEHLARYYYIYGKPGEPYKIALENIQIEWEEEE